MRLTPNEDLRLYSWTFFPFEFSAFTRRFLSRPKAAQFVNVQSKVQWQKSILIKKDFRWPVSQSQSNDPSTLQTVLRHQATFLPLTCLCSRLGELQEPHR